MLFKLQLTSLSLTYQGNSYLRPSPNPILSAKLPEPLDEFLSLSLPFIHTFLSISITAAIKDGGLLKTKIMSFSSSISTALIYICVWGSRGSAGEYQADERAGVVGLSSRVSG